VHILFPQVSYTQKNTSFSITLTLLFPNRHGFHIQSCANRNCPCDGKLYTMFAYTSLFLPINIRKKNCTFISMGNATQKSCKKTNKQNNFRHYEVIKICKSMLFWPRVRCRSEETTNMVYNTAERERERRLFFLHLHSNTSFQSLIV